MVLGEKVLEYGNVAEANGHDCTYFCRWVFAGWMYLTNGRNVPGEHCVVSA